MVRFKKKKKKKKSQGGGRELLDAPKRLSESAIWQMMADYYQNSGESAWEDVPFFVTSSTFIADSYARLLIQFLRDYRDKLVVDHPIYLVDLGAGAGRFGFHLVRALARMQPYFPETADLDLKVVLSDFSPTSVEFWRKHPALQRHIEAKTLDFAVFNPLADTELRLEVAGQVVQPKNPTAFFANYFFDSIPQDAFRVQGDEFLEYFLALKGQPGATVSEAEPNYTLLACELEGRYPQPYAQAILEHYAENVQGNISIPSAGLAALENLRSWTESGLILIATDKGFATQAEMAAMETHTYARHGGAFSLMVNFDALTRYFDFYQGKCLLTNQKSAMTHTLMGLLLPEQPPLTNLNFTFWESINRENLINTVNDMHKLLPPADPESPQDVNALLSFIRLNMCDPRAFTHCAEKLRMQVDELDPGQRAELLEAMEKTWQNYFHSPGEVNLTFWLAFLYFSLNCYEEALKFLDLTMELYDEAPILHGLKGDSHSGLGDWAAAHQSYSRALELSPNTPEFQQALEIAAARI